MKKRRKKKLGLRFILKFYDAYMRERSIERVSEAFEMSAVGMRNKMDRHPILKEVCEIADKHRTANAMKGYILRNLSRGAKKLWEQIQKEGNSLESIEQIFSGKSKRLRQELFVYSLLSSGFNVSKAMRDVGINKTTLDGWRNDFKFLEMVEEIQFHKKNFFETQLMSLVAEAHPGAVMFVNRTVNADRGYNEKLELNHSGQIGGGRSGINLEELDLDLETRKKVLEAIRARREAIAAGSAKPIAALPAPGDNNSNDSLSRAKIHNRKWEADEPDERDDSGG